MAVSALMFVLSIVFVNGKQAQVEFRQGLFLVNSDIRSTINEVSNGRTDTTSYTASRRCYVPSPSVASSRPTFAGTKARGASGGINGCVFLGKVMHFNVTGQPDADTFYNVYSVAGRQMNAKENPVVSFSESRPVPMVTAYSAEDITSVRKLQSGLRITGAYLCANVSCGVSQTVGQFGFFGSFNSSNGANASGSLQSGAQTVTTAVIPASLTKFNMLNRSSAELDIFNSAQAIDPTIHQLGSNRYILLCFKNGSKKGTISIGGINGQQFTTEVKTSNMAAVCPA